MKRVCIVFGGVSNEHEVSRMSAASILRNIDRSRWEVVMLGITKDGRMLRYEGPVELIPDGGWENAGPLTPAVISPDRSHGGLLELHPEGVRPLPVDVVFPVLHGKNGEDGTIQGLCAMAGLPCVGAGMLASALCMDKAVAHVLLTRAGIPKTKLICVLPEDLRDYAALETRLGAELGYPIFIKPANAGSSVGVTKVEAPAGLRAALELAFAHDAKAVAEQAVAGQEIECSVMGNETPVAAEVLGEIVPTTGFYSYEAKYLDDTAGLLVPARVSGETAQRVREIAVRAYRALGCRGFARVDFFVRADGTVILNELNTIPGFTSISMYPKLWEASGMPYGEVIDRLIELALC